MLVLRRDPLVLGGSAHSQPVGHTLGDPVSHPITESVGHTLGDPVTESVGHTLGDPVSHPITESVGQPGSLIAFGSGKHPGNLRGPPAWGPRHPDASIPVASGLRLGLARLIP